MLEEAGVFLGPEQNRAKDALTMKPFLRKWPERYLGDSGWVHAMLAGKEEVSPPEGAMMSDLDEAIENGRAGISRASARWGWKAPRTMLVLPAIHARFPNLVAIHVVRDGRDMAYSQNQGQLEAVGHVVLGEEMKAEPLAVRSAAMWSQMNLAAALYGERLLGDRHLVIRFEDMCADPARGIERMLEHADLQMPAGLAERASELVEAPGSVGRWRDHDPDEVELVRAAGAGGLVKFGYE